MYCGSLFSTKTFPQQFSNPTYTKVLLVHRLDFPFALQAVHGVPDSFVKWSEANTQINQFLGGSLRSHHPALFVLLDPDATRTDDQH